MIAVEELADKAGRLDPAHLKLLAEYVEFLLADQQRQADGSKLVEFSTTEFGSPFAATVLESPDAQLVYKGRSLSLEQMREAVDWEAGQTL